MSSDTTPDSSTEQTTTRDSETLEGSNPPEPITVKVKRFFSPLLPTGESTDHSGNEQVGREFDPTDLPPPVCNTCGFPIEETDQECPARSEGVCSA